MGKMFGKNSITHKCHLTKKEIGLENKFEFKDFESIYILYKQVISTIYLKEFTK